MNRVGKQNNRMAGVVKYRSRYTKKVSISRAEFPAVCEASLDASLDASHTAGYKAFLDTSHTAG